MPDYRKSTRLCRILAPFAVILLALAALPAQATTEPCNDWAAKKSLITGFGNFFEVEGAHRDNLVGNFNLAPPKTHIAPDMVGYSWGGGGSLARLYFVADGCIVAERLYPIKLIWGMMSGYPAVPPDLDKSGERYVQEMRERQALQDRLNEQAMEAQRQANSMEDNGDPDAAEGGDDQFMEEMD